MRLKRFIAFIIDVIIAATSGILLYVILNYFNANIIIPMIAIFAWAIIIGKDCFNGRSFGKYIIGIQVIDSETKQIANPFKCISRNLFYFLTIFDVAVMLLHSKNLRLGDYVTKTEVVPYNKKLRKIESHKAILALGYVLIGLIVVEIFIYFRASSLGLLGYLYN